MNPHLLRGQSVPLLLVVLLLFFASGCGGSNVPGLTAAATPGAQIEVPGGAHFDVPPGWQPVAPQALRASLVAALSNDQVTGDIRTAWETLVSLIDDGVLVGAVSGQSASSAAVISVLIFKVDSESTLEATADAVHSMLPLASTTRELGRSTEHLPIGDVLLIRSAQRPSGGTPTQNIEYVLPLSEKTAIFLNGAAPDGDADLDPVMAQFARSLRVN